MTPREIREAANAKPYGCTCPPGRLDTACSAHNPFKPCPHQHKSVSQLDDMELAGVPGREVVTCLQCGAVL